MNLEENAHLVLYAYLFSGAIFLLGSILNSQDLQKFGKSLAIIITAIATFVLLFMAWAPIILVIAFFIILIFVGRLFS